MSELSKESGILFSTKSVSVFLGILVYCIFASSTGQEYIHGTLKNLLVRQPNRSKLLFGKLLALNTFAISLIITISTIGISMSFAMSRKAKVNTQKWNLFSSYFGSEMLNIALAIFAYGLLGSAIPRTPSRARPCRRNAGPRSYRRSSSVPAW